MKEGIHPAYRAIKVVCNCNNEFTVGSAIAEDMLKENTLRIEVCNACHPFYTGKQNLIDTGGKVEKFNNRFAGLVVGLESTKKGG
jgi:large subunit ribosomal protein L31